MVKEIVLAVAPGKDSLNKYKSLIEREHFSFLLCDHLKEGLKKISEENIHLVLIEKNVNDGKKIREKFYSKPLQLIYIAGEDEDISSLSQEGYDDFLHEPFSDLEFQARLNAAYIRYQHQKNILDERNFFKQAVRKEEAISASILDQHIHLKKAFQNIESLNAELTVSNEKLEKIARYDLLSGLLNRMSLFSIIDIEIERAFRTYSPLSGIMMDIDNFKEINDNFGHLLGDEVIRVFGKQLKKSLRKYDHAGRYGGEEFFAILPNTQQSQAFNIAERFRIELQKTKIKHNSSSIQTTVSIGIAELSKNESRESWLARSDKAMYTAKKRGRNMTVIYSPENS